MFLLQLKLPVTCGMSDDHATITESAAYGPSVTIYSTPATFFMN